MVARIVVEVIKDPPLTAGVQWNSALETIDVSAKKLGYDLPFMGACNSPPSSCRAAVLTGFARVPSRT